MSCHHSDTIIKVPLTFPGNHQQECIYKCTVVHEIRKLTEISKKTSAGSTEAKSLLLSWFVQTPANFSQPEMQ